MGFTFFVNAFKSQKNSNRSDADDYFNKSRTCAVSYVHARAIWSVLTQCYIIL